MMPSPLIDGRPNTRYSCWLTAGSDRTRIGPLNWPAGAPSILSCNVRSTNFYHHAAFFELKRERRPQRSNLGKPRPAAKSP